MRRTIYTGWTISVHVSDERWEVVERADAVAVLAVSGDRVLGVRQYRPAIGLRTWELPAGLVEQGEDPERTALRELSEEANLTGQLRRVTSGYPSPGFCTEKITLFEATNLSSRPGVPDPFEEVAVEWRVVDDAWAEIASGREPSSLATLLGLAVARSRRGGGLTQ